MTFLQVCLNRISATTESVILSWISLELSKSYKLFGFGQFFYGLGLVAGDGRSLFILFLLKALIFFDVLFA